MLLLHEMDKTNAIPEVAIKTHVAALNRIPLKIFPIHPDEMPADVDPYRGTPCHCQLGNVYQVLAAWGLDVDKELPWIRPWFLRYQMADGALNCDNGAYLVKDECPSSMVGTIAAFEAILIYTPRPWTTAERKFLDNGANFLIARKLTQGSSTKYNSSETTSAKNWSRLCFPRFYLYDILRGLNALTLWAEMTNQSVSADAFQDVVSFLDGRFPDGAIQIGRKSYEGAGTLIQSATGEWNWSKEALLFPLLTEVSKVGEQSHYLSMQWTQVKERLKLHANLFKN